MNKRNYARGDSNWSFRHARGAFLHGCVVVACLMAGLAVQGATTEGAEEQGAKDQRSFQGLARLGGRATVLPAFNQRFIEGMCTPEAALDDVHTVLGLLFSALPSEAMIYPSENYYYFILHLGGHELWGNLRFSPEERDAGILPFAYFDRAESATRTGTELRVIRNLEVKDGVLLERREPSVYQVTYRGKMVTFRLHELDQTPPVMFGLREDEVFVARTFDESGYQFFLLFNTKRNYFLWVLNEEEVVPDELVPMEDFKRVHQEVVIGKLSGFVFWVNRDEGVRKILVGVRQASVARNDYFDGPFDQLADNYVEQTRVGDYMQMANPSLRGRIDLYGHFTDPSRPGRVALTNYYVYLAKTDLVEFLVKAILAEDPWAYVSQRGAGTRSGYTPRPAVVPRGPSQELEVQEGP